MSFQYPDEKFVSLFKEIELSYLQATRVFDQTNIFCG